MEFVMPVHVLKVPFELHNITEVAQYSLGSLNSWTLNHLKSDYLSPSFHGWRLDVFVGSRKSMGSCSLN